MTTLNRRANVKAVVLVMAMRVVALGGNVCCGLLTAAFLGPDGRGVLAALLLSPTVLSPLSTLGLHASLVYNLRSDPGNQSRYFGSAIVLIGAASVVATGLGYFLIPYGLRRYDAETINLARMLLFIMPFTVLSPLMTGVLEAHGKFGVANQTLYFVSLTALTTLVVLAAAGWLTPLTASLAYVCPAFPAFFYLMFQARRVLKPVLTVAAPYPGRLLRFGLRFYGVDVLGSVSGYLDQLVIVLLLDPSAVGAYAVALSLSRVMGVAQGAVATVLFPSIAGRAASDVVEMVGRTVRITTVVNLSAALATGLAGPSLLLLMYGNRFAAALVPFLVLLGEVVVTSAARTLAQAFSSTGRPSAVTAMEVVGVLTSLVAMLVLVPPFGIVGAACSTLLGGCMRLAFALGGFRKVLGVALPRLVFGRGDVAWILGR